MDNYELLCDKISRIILGKDILAIKKDYLSISKQYQSESINSRKVVDSDNLAIAYMGSRMPETASIVYDVIARLLDRIGSDNINSVLDIGSGTGAVEWAIDTLISASVVGLEQEKSMIKYAKLLSSGLTNSVEYVNGNILSKLDSVSPCDMVIESFVLNELNIKDTYKALDNIVSLMGKYLVLIESGTPVSYSRMMDIRSYLLDKGLKLILPCPHSDTCGLIDDYCNFTCRVPRSKLHKAIKSAVVPYSDEKYFYLIFSKVVEPNHTSTVLRHPIYRKSCVDLKLCNSGTSISSVTVTKSDKSGYRLAKSCKQGDVIVE